MSRSNGFLPDKQKLLNQNRLSVPNFIKIHSNAPAYQIAVPPPEEGGETAKRLFRVYLKNSLRLHHGVFSAISASGNLGQSRTISRKG